MGTCFYIGRPARARGAAVLKAVWRRPVALSALLATVVVGCSLAPVAPGRSSAPMPGSGPPAPASDAAPPAATGTLLFVDVDGYWALDLQTNTTTRRWPFPDGTMGSAPTASPDGTQIAFPQSTYGSAGGHTDLLLAAPDGSGQRVLLSNAVPGDSPAFSADGKVVYATDRGPNLADQLQAISVDHPDQRTSLGPGRSPTTSPAGALAFVTLEPATASGTLWLTTPGSQERRRLLGGQDVQYLANPRFDPTGQHIAFVAAAPQTTAQTLATWGLWFGPSIALAHSVALDLWVIDADGTHPRRLTNIDDHLAYPTWSPDGRWLAFNGEPGVYLVAASGEAPPRRLLDRGLPSGLTWLP